MTRSDKIRVSQHSGREGSARHNDRTFMDGKSHAWIAEHADHIDTARTDENHYMTCNNDPDFEKSERDYYHQAYTAGQDAVNARYVKSGHPERCKTVDDLYTGKLTRPEEMILQIGDRNSGIDGDTFTHAVCDYMDRVLAWSAEHGNPMRLLNVAIHLDEGSPHAHIRRVWEYRDKDGLARLGQNKALEAAGIEPPRPGEKLGRYNNRKMTFDSMARGVWQEVCREYGFEIETEPRPDMRHKSKQDYVRDQMTAEIDTLRQEKAAAIAQIDMLRQKQTGLTAQIDTQEAQIRTLTAKNDKLQQEAAEARKMAQDALQEYQTAAGRTQAEQRRVNELREEISELDIVREISSIPQNRILEDAKATAKKTLIGDNVTLPRIEYERICGLAENNWANMQAIQNMQREKWEAQRDAAAAEERAWNKARQQSIEKDIENAKRDRDLQTYQAMRSRFPDTFRQMAEMMRQERQQSRGRDR